MGEWLDEIVDISEEGDTDMRIDWIGMANFYRQRRRMRSRLRGTTVSSSAGSTYSTAASLAMISNPG
jgi:hypothetical protein